MNVRSEKGRRLVRTLGNFTEHPGKARNKLFKDFAKSLGFSNEVQANKKIFINSQYPSIKLFICFFPCRSGIQILDKQSGRRLYQDRVGNLEEFSKELVKYRKNE